MKPYEWGFDTEGERVVVHYYDETGKASYVQPFEDCSEDAILYIISDKTMYELEAILELAGGNLTFNQKRKLYSDFNTCLRFFELSFALYGRIENQKALDDLIIAFDALGFDGQTTLLETFLRKGRFKYPGGLSNGADPEGFLKTAKSLLTEVRTPGRKRDYGTETKIMLARTAWGLFEELGLKTPITNTGHLAQFISVLWKDPALGELRGSPEDLRDYLREIKKDKETAAKKIGGELE